MVKESGIIQKDKLLRKCERLMLMGVDSPADIARELKISYNTAKVYSETVHARWSDTKSIVELQSQREELVRMTKQAIHEAWKEKESAKNTEGAIMALKTVLLGIERLAKLLAIETIPPAIEPPPENQIFLFAQEYHKLPPDQKTLVMERVKFEIKKRKEGESCLRN